MDRFPRQNNTVRNEWDGFEADDVWVFDPIDADVEMSVNGDDDTSSDNEDSDDDASDDENMSSEEESNEGDDDDNILERLGQNDPSLTEISIDYAVEWRPTTNAEWLDMGDMLANNTHITNLSIVNDMDGEVISTVGERKFYAGLQNNRSIQNLHFTGPLPAIFTFVHPSNKFWEENKNLIKLSLNGIYGVGRQEMMKMCSVIVAAKNLAHLEISYSIDEDDHDLFSMLLQTLRWINGHSLKSLGLQGNTIGAASMSIMTEIPFYCPNLEILNLEDTTIGYHSCEAIASLLQHPSSSLIWLNLWGCSIDDRGALQLANALKRTNCLRTLTLGGNNITTEGWDVFSTLVCNKSSLLKTVTSNHILEELEVNDEHQPLVDDFLALNLSGDKRAVVMNKAIKFHIADVVKLGVKLQPTIMACIGADQKVGAHPDACSEYLRCDLLASMFSIVRTTPSLFEYASHECDQPLASDVFVFT